MSYVYQWFGAVNGYAFLYGCMLGMAAQAMRQAGRPLLPVRSAPSDPRRNP